MVNKIKDATFVEDDFYLPSKKNHSIKSIKQKDIQKRKDNEKRNKNNKQSTNKNKYGYQTDIKNFIVRRFSGDIVQTDFSDAISRDFMHGVQFQLKKNKQDDIYIFTDGFVVRQDSNNLIDIEKTNGFGIYINAREKDVFTYGIATMDSDKSTSNLIELLALENSLLHLNNHYEDIKNRNVYIFSDNLNNIKAISLLIDKKNKEPNFNFISHSSHEHIQVQHKIAEFLYEHKINLTWIRGHSNYKQNEMVDKLAKKASTVEIETHLSGVSRLPDVYGIHTFTSVNDKTQAIGRIAVKASLDKKIDKVNIHQKSDLGNTVITIKNGHVDFYHKNYVSSHTSFYNRKLIVESDYRLHRREHKKNFSNMSVKDLEKMFSDDVKKLTGKILASNLNSSLKFLEDTCKAFESSVHQLNFNSILNYEKPSSLIEKTFFHSVDHHFKYINPLFKYVDNMDFNLTLPLPIKRENAKNERENLVQDQFLDSELHKVNLKRQYHFVKDENVYYLSNHKNNTLFKKIANSTLKVENGFSANTLILSEKGEVNEQSSLIFRMTKEKINKNEVKNPIEDRIDKKFSINPLAEMKRKRN